MSNSKIALRLVNHISIRTAPHDADAQLKPIAWTILTLLLLATWSLLHRYKGLSQDGELYAFQALARLNPALRSDVYLMGNSQDEFTVFSPLYALVIRCLGLWDASVALFVACTTAFIAAAWVSARSLWDETRAWACAATCIVIVSGYGAYDVFSYSENYLTARSMAEAMVIIALACHLRDLRRWSWTLAVASMFIHPLMALPGLLLLACLSVPLSYAALGAGSGVLAALGVALLALHIGHGPRILAIINGPWLEMVKQRSQYLFLQVWRWHDWDVQLRPLLCLTLASLVTERPRVRSLCWGAMLVGVTGLVVALIASTIGPVAILLQGQAWRWMWVTGFISVLMLAPTAHRLWRDPGCGTICATLLVAGWTFPPVDGSLMAAAALVLWCLRRHVRPESRILLQGLAYAMIAAIVAWTGANSWSLCASPPVDLRGEPLLIERLRSIYALQLPALALVCVGLRWLRPRAHGYAYGIGLALLIPVCTLAAHGSFNRNTLFDTSSGTQGLEQWRAVIPPASNVLVLPSTKAAGFIWFTLGRPSYLTVDQSAGVVFSQETAQEIRRRSEVLRPVEDPNWRIMSQLARTAKVREKPGKEAGSPRPLTAEDLRAVCRDAQLGFVIAKERLGFDSIPSTASGQWKDWNLYACRRVRQMSAGG